VTPREFPRGRWWTALAAVVGVLVALWLAVVEVFWLPLRVGAVPIPASLVGAALGNLLIVGAVRRVTGSGPVAVLPAVAWLAVVVPAMIQRPEGDLLIVGGGNTGVVNLGFLLVGVLAAAYAVGRALSGPRRPPVRRAGSGTGGAR
jgi:hypothetical protein